MYNMRSFRCRWFSIDHNDHKEQRGLKAYEIWHSADLSEITLFRVVKCSDAQYLHMTTDNSHDDPDKCNRMLFVARFNASNWKKAKRRANKLMNDAFKNRSSNVSS